MTVVQFQAWLGIWLLLHIRSQAFNNHTMDAATYSGSIIGYFEKQVKESMGLQHH